MTRSGLVSVVIPAFNAERYLAETLESCLAQTYRDIEVLVVDDGSSDGTAALVAEFASRDPRVVLLRQANSGVAAARNRAIAECSGEFVSTLDADDLWHPTKIEKQVAALHRGGDDFGVAYTWSLFVDEASRPTGHGMAPVIEGDVYLPIICYNFLACGSNALVRKKCFDRVGGFKSGLVTEDHEILVRFGEYYRFAAVPEYLLAYRQLATSRSQYPSRLVREKIALLEGIRDRHPEIPPRIYGWGRGITYRFAAVRSAQCGKLLDAAKFALFGVLNDPARFLLRPTEPFGDIASRRRAANRAPAVQAVQSGDAGSFWPGPRRPAGGELTAERIAYMKSISLDRRRYPDGALTVDAGVS